MLEELFKKKTASLVVIRGRRRVEKSRLAQEFAHKTPHYVFSGLPPTKGISMMGGVPRSLEEILPNQSAEKNIQRLCFQKEGFLSNEFERIFSDLFFSRSAIYKIIVERLAEGPCELKDIYTALKVEKSSLVSEYMEDLVTAGFVSRDFTWHLRTGLDSKLSHYRLKDHYLRFYLK